jgi:hypothetical protein
MANTVKAALGNMRTHLWIDRNKEGPWLLVDRSDMEVVLAYVAELEGKLGIDPEKSGT